MEPSDGLRRLYSMDSIAADAADCERVTDAVQAETSTEHPLRVALRDPATLERLVRFAVFVAGSVEQGEDVCGEVVARIWERAPRYGADSPEQFLRRAVVNEVRSRWRRLDRRRRMAAPAAKPGTDDGTSAVDSALLLGDALAVLRPLERAVLVARYVDDMTESDTAALLGVSVGTVKSASSRARARLQSTFDRGGSHE